VCHSLHAQFAGPPATRAAHPHDAILPLVVSHSDIQYLPGANLSAESLQNDAGCTHVSDNGRIHEGLSVRIKAPDLNRQLHIDSRAVTPVHEPSQNYFAILLEN